MCLLMVQEAEIKVLAGLVPSEYLKGLTLGLYVAIFLGCMSISVSQCLPFMRTLVIYSRPHPDF